MKKVSVSDLRQNLPKYLSDVRNGDELEVTQHGKTIARIVPEQDEQAAARRRLAEMRKRGARITGDIIGPSGEIWDAER
jgi:prevent-host-death family protein